MAMTGSKAQTPEETAAIISATAIVRGTDGAKSQIIGILGRARSFTRVHVAMTDIDLGKAPQERGGYKVATIAASTNPATVAAIGKAISEWLKVCHGPRYEAAPAKPVLKPGTRSLYLAVSYPAAAATSAKKS